MLLHVYDRSVSCWPDTSVEFPQPTHTHSHLRTECQYGVGGRRPLSVFAHETAGGSHAYAELGPLAVVGEDGGDLFVKCVCVL